MTWIDNKKWHEKWEKLKDLGDGGQGKAFLAHRKDDKTHACIKVIKHNKDDERRRRFCREATAYDTYRIENIPKLIESNAHHHSDVAYELYIATDFIEGSTLEKWRGKHTPDLRQAVEITRSLLFILRDVHANQCVHRDIKPDNIILRENDPSKVMLLDFGLSYHDISENDISTMSNQEGRISTLLSAHLP